MASATVEGGSVNLTFGNVFAALGMPVLWSPSWVLTCLDGSFSPWAGDGTWVVLTVRGVLGCRT